MTTPLEHALAFWRRDLSVIPVPRPRPDGPVGQPGDGKVPALAWRTYQTRRPTKAELSQVYGRQDRRQIMPELLTTAATAAGPFAGDRDRLIGEFAVSEHQLARTLAAMRQMVAILLGELQAQTLSNKRQAASYRRLRDVEDWVRSRRPRGDT